MPKHRPENLLARRLQGVIGGCVQLICLVVCACAIAGLTIVSTAAAGAPRHVRASQGLAQLLFEHHAHRLASTGSPVVAVLPARSPITGEPTTLPVLRRQAGHGSRVWLKVMLPGRPNGATGWIAHGGTSESETEWHLMISTASRRVWVYLGGRLQTTFAAVVGKPSTPTPSGSFFVQETVAMPDTARAQRPLRCAAHVRGWAGPNRDTRA
jgi:hypothetical protein